MPFGNKIDVWSLGIIAAVLKTGCVLCQMFSGTPLFKPANTSGLITQITALLGCFPNQMLQQSMIDYTRQNKHLFHVSGCDMNSCAKSKR